MISFSSLTAFLMTCLVIEITPGPNMGYLALLGMTEGRKAGFAAVLGIVLGLLIVGLAAALGLAAVIANSDTLYQILRWGGIAYLLWLAWDGWRTNTEISPGKTDKAPVSTRRYFQRGLITNLLNPKAALFYVAILPGFVETAAPVVPQLVLMTVLSVIIATIIHGVIVWMAGTIAPFLEDPRRERAARKVFSALLVLIALWFAWSTAR